ncbi:HNH endonuclease signature motif containing protein [Streptosporangium sp. NPDC001681]|uniref:HNH endonuclease n=1 Tax=Streptosporangium sp. NPDC001681 TaxID=3154395 RepID=UPI00331C7996
MWQIDPPSYTAASSFRACISRVRNRDLKERLHDVEGKIVLADQDYTAAANNVTLHSLEPKNFSLDPRVTGQELIGVYKNGMVRRGGGGRKIYDELILAAKDGRCPLCGHRQVSTLDHHLPKTIYPALAVNPNNLIPACSDCNKMKLDAVPASSDQETLHPYFDNVENDAWLRAEVVEVTPAALKFYIDPPDSWDSTMVRRVNLHFKTFGLGGLYAAQASYELSNIRYYLSQIYAAGPTGGTERVRKHLKDQAQSRRNANTNSWQTATYQALADSLWYCSDGFSI